MSQNQNPLENQNMMTFLNEGIDVPEELPDIYKEVTKARISLFDEWVKIFNESIDRQISKGKTEQEARKEVLNCMEVLGFDDIQIRNLINKILDKRTPKYTKMNVSIL